MIQKFVDRFMEKKTELRSLFAEKKPDSYKDLVQAVIQLVSEDGYNIEPDPNRITEIDHGDYQGTLLYIIGANGYQPSDFWSVMVQYGSCSGCDTLQAIECDGNYDEKPNEKQLDQYMTLALHVVQGLKEIGDN